MAKKIREQEAKRKSDDKRLKRAIRQEQRNANVE
jgi:hypothetical protein